MNEFHSRKEDPATAVMLVEPVGDLTVNLGGSKLTLGAAVSGCWCLGVNKLLYLIRTTVERGHNHECATSAQAAKAV